MTDEQLAELAPWSEKVQSIKNRMWIIVNYSNSQRAGVILYLTALIFGGYKGTVSINVSNSSEPVTSTGYTYTISSNSNLRNDITRSYTFTITDSSGNDITSSQNDYSWNVVSDFTDQIEQVITDNKIRLTVDNEDLVGETFVLQVLVNSDVKASFDIMVIDLF